MILKFYNSSILQQILYFLQIVHNCNYFFSFLIFFAQFLPMLNLIIILTKTFKSMSQSLELLRGFICGSFSGCAQVFVMQPFEIIKVRLVNQSLLNPEYKGIKDCFKKILKQEGIRSFYKGTLSPLLGYGIQGALVFGSNQIFKKMIKYINRDDIKPGQAIPMSQILLSGILTGMVSSLVLTPADHTRIMMQKEIKNLHKSSIDAGKSMYKNHGLKGLYLGFNPTFARQVIANAVYFYSYEYIMRIFAPEGQGSASAPIMFSFFAGGLSGSASWFLSYPIDYIKTRMQSQNLAGLQYKNAVHCALQLYKAEGIRTFFKGLGITLLRSFPVNGIAFFSYEYIMRSMGWKKQ